MMETKHVMRSLLLASMLVLLVTTGLYASTLTITLQRGQGSPGLTNVSDTFLYGVASVAESNYGGYGTLTSGKSQWNETYVAIIRFDLGAIPKQARVKRATLALHTVQPQMPQSPFTLDAQAITTANAGWVEGNGVGYAVPGTACWNARAQGGARWAGAPGLGKAGVDYDTQLVATTSISPKQEGWITLDLAVEAVQRWISDPATNAGLRLAARGELRPGDVLSVHSSDAVASEMHPKLTLELEMTPAQETQFGQQRAASLLANANQKIVEAGAATAAAGNPERAVTSLRQLQNRLARLQASNASVRLWDAANCQRLSVDVQGIEAAAARLVRRLPLLKAAAVNAEREQAADFALGVADSMEHVMRPAERFTGDFPAVVDLALARNEFEALQVVIVPVDRPVRGARWQVTALQGPGRATIPVQDIQVSPVGYIHSQRPAPSKTPADWWPCQLLDFLQTIDVKRGEVQPLWVLVRTREQTPPGVYEGTLTVTGEGVAAKSLRLRARVFDFAIPKEQHLRTIWGFTEEASIRLYGERHTKDKLAQRMFQMLLDHRLAVNSLYNAQSGPGEVGPQHGLTVGLPSIARPEDLRRLWDAGSRWWNLGYMHPVYAERAGLTIDEFTPVFIEMMRESLAFADAAGWPHQNLSIYMYDETRLFDELNRVATKVKAAFPDITIMTTAYDTSFGVKGGPIDKSMDAWCPLIPVFADNLANVREGQKAGNQVWWYVCTVPGGKYLNFFVQQQPICGRLLMGSAAWKYAPDGFLYYAINGWNNYQHPISRWPLTDWVPYFRPDGDGELICPGPEGPLSTVVFEGIRDGLEDYEYYWLLHDLVAQAQKQGVQTADAERLLSVPPDVLSSLTVYTEQPSRLRAQRLTIATAIEKLQAQLRVAGKR